MEWGLRSGISDEVPGNAASASPRQSVDLLDRWACWTMLESVSKGTR